MKTNNDTITKARDAAAIGDRSLVRVLLVEGALDIPLSTRYRDDDLLRVDVEEDRPFAAATLRRSLT